MHLRCFFLVKIVAIYALLVCKIFVAKIRSCKFFDKSQVWGGVPPNSAKLFWAEWFPLRGEGGVPPNSAKRTGILRPKTHFFDLFHRFVALFCLLYCLFGPSLTLFNKKKSFRPFFFFYFSASLSLSKVGTS